jgi:hypothetical protein
MREHQLFGFFSEIVGTVRIADGTPPALLRVVGYGAARFFVLENGTYMEKNVTDAQLVRPTEALVNGQGRFL